MTPASPAVPPAAPVIGIPSAIDPSGRPIGIAAARSLTRSLEAGVDARVDPLLDAREEPVDDLRLELGAELATCLDGGHQVVAG